MVAKSKKAAGKAKKSPVKAKKSGGKAKAAKKSSHKRAKSSGGPRSRSGGGDVTLTEIDYSDTTKGKTGQASISVTIAYWAAVSDGSQNVPKGTNSSYTFTNVKQVTSEGVSFPATIPTNTNKCVSKATFSYDGTTWSVTGTQALKS